jgi:hypothetical protein
MPGSLGDLFMENNCMASPENLEIQLIPRG